MMKENLTRSKFFNIIYGMLWNSDLPLISLSKADCLQFMEVSEEQTVQGLVCDALLKNRCLEEDDIYEVIGLQIQIEQQNQLVNHELVKFARELESLGITYIIVKGQILATHYPNPLTRMPGDVDIYLPGRNYNKAIAYVERLTGKELAKFSDGKHVEFTRKDVVFELHDRLSQFSTKTHQRYFDHLIDKVILESNDTVVIEDYAVKTLPPTYNILYTFIHLFYHLTAQGIGLRQFCDLAVLIGTASVEELNKGELEEHLKALGLLKAFRAVGSVLVDYLGLQSEKFPFDLTDKDKRWGHKILKNVMKRGNFGRNFRRVTNIGILHSLESGVLVLKQTFVYLPLAPVEVGGRFFSIGSWFVQRLFLKN
jgi:hypothetical protein